MTYPLLAPLACLCLLLSTCPTKAQTKPLAVASLRPRVVQVDSGTTVQRRLIGFTPDAYDELRAGQASDERLLLVRATRIQTLLRTRRADSLSLVAASNEIRRLREERAHAYALLSRQELAYEKLGSRPLQKPMLFDPNYYKGILTGILLDEAGRLAWRAFLPHP